MRVIMVMFDSLNRRMLPPYGCEWIHAPNFKRLTEQTVTFDNCYIGSMPCMPARRELHTGRYNFLHRSWGPIEPFDDSMPEILKQNGVYTNLVSDHAHYWEDGGATYHTRYSSWEISRGQEGDLWKGEVKDPTIENAIGGTKRLWRQDWINRKYLQREEAQPQAKTFGLVMEFIKKNHTEDDWFLQIETFDPHEPFFTQQKYKDLYPHDYQGPHFDWPDYKRVTETPDQVEHVRYEYAALVSMCDHYLGQVLDLMDHYDMWKDTMLIVNTDHGYLLAEHEWWAKCMQPFYNEVAHIPLFIWDPRSGKRGERNSCLVQMIDFAPTLLEYFGVDIPQDMLGKTLKDVIASNRPIREAALFGLHGAHVNITDGRYVYMRGPARPENGPVYDYTLMPTHMRKRFSVAEMRSAELAGPFSFTKGCPVMKTKSLPWEGRNYHQFGTLLFDLEQDPQQEEPLHDPVVEERLVRQMIRLMKENDAPEEQYQRLGLCFRELK
jgi:arylsulfatase A-like enzyme